MIMQDPTRVAFLISGSGSTMEAAIKAAKNDTLPGISPVVVISSNKKALGISKAQALGIPTKIIERKQFETPEMFGEELLRICQEYDVELISANGWLPLTPGNVIQTFKNKIINQHLGPLDPGRGFDFGGVGMYGLRVMASRFIFEWGINDIAPWTEATVHFVTEEFDKGDLVHTTKVSLPLPEKQFSLDELKNNRELQTYLKETVINFQKEFLPIEHQTVIAALSLFSFGKIPEGFQRSTPLIEEKDKIVLEKSKQLAIELFPTG